jgi:hypothetical protein
MAPQKCGSKIQPNCADCADCAGAAGTADLENVMSLLLLLLLPPRAAATVLWRLPNCCICWPIRRPVLPNPLDRRLYKTRYTLDQPEQPDLSTRQHRVAGSMLQGLASARASAGRA